MDELMVEKNDMGTLPGSDEDLFRKLEENKERRLIKCGTPMVEERRKENPVLRGIMVVI